jgi:hypothetical protein
LGTENYNSIFFFLTNQSLLWTLKTYYIYLRKIFTSPECKTVTVIPIDYFVNQILDLQRAGISIVTPSGSKNMGTFVVGTRREDDVLLSELNGYRMYPTLGG